MLTGKEAAFPVGLYGQAMQAGTPILLNIATQLLPHYLKLIPSCPAEYVDKDVTNASGWALKAAKNLIRAYNMEEIGQLAKTTTDTEPDNTIFLIDISNHSSLNTKGPGKIHYDRINDTLTIKMGEHECTLMASALVDLIQSK